MASARDGKVSHGAKRESNTSLPMDDSISVQNIRNFLNINGGTVKHSEMVAFFKRPLTDGMLKGNVPFSYY